MTAHQLLAAKALRHHRQMEAGHIFAMLMLRNGKNVGRRIEAARKAYAKEMSRAALNNKEAQSKS